MDKNEEIKKDIELLDYYIKNGNPNNISKFIDALGNKHGIPPEFIKKTIDYESNFKVNEKLFIPQNGTPEYHRLKINMFTRMTICEVQHIESNIQQKVNITNKRIREWYNYTENELKEYNESIEFLKELNLCKEIKKDYLAIGIVSKLKHDLIIKFWWRMGLLGIKERIKIFRVKIK